MNSAWEDDGWGGDDEELADDAPAEAPKGGDVYVPQIELEKSGSRIIKRKTSLPRCRLSHYIYFAKLQSDPSQLLQTHVYIFRCKLVAHILREFPNGSVSDIETWVSDSTDGPVLSYLRGLPPPAVDVEFQALCLNDDDEEGIDLLRCMLCWLKRNLASGRNFEIVQAYLHRLLRIYGSLIASHHLLCADLDAVKLAQSECALKFRHLVQSNLCLLKMLAGLPPT
jgi:hypothetical protein